MAVVKLEVFAQCNAREVHVLAHDRFRAPCFAGANGREHAVMVVVRPAQDLEIAP